MPIGTSSVACICSAKKYAVALVAATAAGEFVCQLPSLCSAGVTEGLRLMEHILIGLLSFALLIRSNAPSTG